MLASLSSVFQKHSEVRPKTGAGNVLFVSVELAEILHAKIEETLVQGLIKPHHNKNCIGELVPKRSESARIIIQWICAVKNSFC